MASPPGGGSMTVTAMLAVRRRAPAGSYFQDGDRASGVFGVLATGFSVLLGFIIFLSFQSYDSARTGADLEARTTPSASAVERIVAARCAREAACKARVAAIGRARGAFVIDFRIPSPVTPP